MFKPRTETLSAVLCAVLCIGLLSGGEIVAQMARPSVLEPAAAPAAGPRAPELMVRERFVRVVESSLESEEVKLDLFDDVTVEASHERTDITGPASKVWIGRLIGQEGRVFLSTVDGVTVGLVRTAEKLYQIRYVGGGINAVDEIDAARFPNEQCDNGGESRQPAPTGGSSTPPPTPNAPLGGDPCNVIDLVVLYTPAAKDAVGGAQAMEAEIHLAISVSNITFEDSAITARFSPVHIDEIDYVEAATRNDDGDAFDDRDALRDTDDGVMDEAHTLRDRYCGDVVHLITNIGGNDENWCGAAYVMDPAPSDAHEVNGFAVTRWSCGSTQFTFAHEMGHIFGARHDWYVDDADTPYTYAHGYVNRAEGWRTVMAYNTECDDLGFDCDRHGIWSSPNEFIDGQPAGIAEGTSTACTEADLANPDCDAENWRVINATDCTVANFRDRSECIASGARNVWMKDTWFDTGLEPDFWTAGQDMWKSPYIWVRNNQDLTGAKQHIHQNPEQGQVNYVYTKLHNDFDVLATGQLKLYYAKASTGLTWPGDWTEFANNTVNIGAHATLLSPSTWTPPGTGHYCLLARWTTPNNPSDPMAAAEGNSVSTNARRNNNIVSRNLNVVNLVPNVTVPLPPLDVKSTLAAPSTLTLAIELPDVGDNFISAGGQVLLDLDGLHDNWVGSGAAGNGVQQITHPLYGVVVQILDSTSGVATLEGISITTGEVEPIRFILTAPYVAPPPPFPPQNDDPQESPTGPVTADGGVTPVVPVHRFVLEIVQIEGTERVGGVGYEIDVQAQGGSGAVPDGYTVSGTPLRLSRDVSGGLILDWDASCSSEDTDYAVYSGTLGDFKSHTPASCSTARDTTVTLAAVPVADTYFLVVPTDELTDGSFGLDSRGVERPAGPEPCRPHAVITCK